MERRDNSHTLRFSSRPCAISCNNSNNGRQMVSMQWPKALSASHRLLTRVHPNGPNGDFSRNTGSASNSIARTFHNTLKFMTVLYSVHHHRVCTVTVRNQIAPANETTQALPLLAFCRWPKACCKKIVVKFSSANSLMLVFARWWQSISFL